MLVNELSAETAQRPSLNEIWLTLIFKKGSLRTYDADLVGREPGNNCP